MASTLLLAFAGCAKVEPLDAKIAADDTTTFLRWKRDVVAEFPPAMQQRFETALQDLRLDIQFKGEASGRDGIESAICQRLNRHSVKEALLMALDLKWHRLESEHGDLQRVLAANARLITKPGDQAAANDLAEYRGKQQARLDATTQELQSVEKEIASLGGKPPVPEAQVTTTQRRAMSRDEARQQVGELLEGRRTAASTRYGQWPVRIDWSGRSLDENKRAEFSAKHAAAAREGKVVIPIRIKRTWLLFEGLDQAPALPDDVKSFLTPAEQLAFKKNWLEVEAEIWARQIAKELPDPPPEPVEEKPDEQPQLIHK